MFVGYFVAIVYFLCTAGILILSTITYFRRKEKGFMLISIGMILATLNSAFSLINTCLIYSGGPYETTRVWSAFWPIFSLLGIIGLIIALIGWFLLALKKKTV
jgi:hypothetical protein